MTRLRVILLIVAVSQLVLGLAVISVPGPFLATMGLSVPPADTNYMLGMLGARFLAYGIGMLALARSAAPDPLWIRNMVLVQLIDLAAGLYYLGTGVIGIRTAAFPMFNAALFASLLWLWQPRARSGAAAPEAL